MQREAHTLDDLADLFADYAVVVQLTDGPEVYLQFPKAEGYAAKYRARVRVDTHLADKFGTDYQPQDLAFAHVTKSVLADLLASPEFWRQTTVAMVVDNWRHRQKEYGKIKGRKRANEPFTLIFESNDSARRFFMDLARVCEQQT